ncbi:MFS transporter [Sinirhodobacter populi]|uniref:MFS transporter n=1 Tax=Paenirhodobacter populi TaxID=2306993 RepID=A0A443JYM8_9RHOB|nr:MFS transporter [Sinirhodobacter populi]RWR25584.1 MFS transporter [Sinirhodobacter populi]
MIALRFVDLSPLIGNPGFRRLWVGTSFQTLGNQFFAFAVLYQMWEMTRSPLMTGAVGLTLALPMLVFGLWGGILADTWERRGLILLANFGAIVFALGLAAQSLAGWNSPTLLLALAAALAACTSAGQPARKAMIPALLPREKVGGGIALSHASFQAAMLGGPALAGIVAGLWGTAGCYAAQAVAFALAFHGLLALPKTPPPQTGENRIGSLMAGFHAIRRHPPLRGTLLTDLAATALAMPIALFPALNEARFDGAPETLGLFLSAIAVGGIAATVLSGGITRHPRQGAIQLGAALLWGLALASAGLVQSGWLTLACLVVAGAADTVAVMARGSIVQLSCEPEMRGRVLAAEQVAGVAAPQIGNFRAGAMAAIMPPGISLAFGGLFCVAAVIGIAVTHPRLVRLRTTIAM